MPQNKKRLLRKIETAVKSIIPCLWFDRQAEEAARFYVSLFPDSHVDEVVEAPADFPSGKKGDVLSVDFTLMGRKFSGLNGGPYFKFNEAVSLTVPCESQAEVDRYWLSWQIVPTMLYGLLADPDRKKAGRVMEVMLKMKKLDIKTLQQAFEHAK